MRLFLDPKDLIINNKEKQWYGKIIDDILTDLPGSILFTL